MKPVFITMPSIMYMYYTLCSLMVTFDHFQILDCDVIPKSVRTFFTSLVLDTMKEREMNNILRHDIIHLLMEAKKGLNQI